MIESFINTYASLFDFSMWQTFFSDGQAWGLILTLIIMEGLLSADNALVLAIMVKKLPEHQQKKALFYGLLGAYFFRFLAIGIGLFLVKFWYIKLIGALYLYFLAIKFFYKMKRVIPENKIKNNQIKNKLLAFVGPFWATIISIELMDLAFSVDSILAAIALVNDSASHLQMPALLLGGILGILMMRGVAGVFLKLLKKIPELEITAHILIFLIATKMLLGVFDIHIHNYIFFTILFITFALTFVIHFYNKKNQIKN